MKVINGTSSRHLALVSLVERRQVALGGGRTSCIAALAHLAPHHHLPGHTADLTVGHGTGDSHPGGRGREGQRKREKYMNSVFIKQSYNIEHISKLNVSQM